MELHGPETYEPLVAGEGYRLEPEDQDRRLALRSVDGVRVGALDRAWGRCETLRVTGSARVDQSSGGFGWAAKLLSDEMLIAWQKTGFWPHRYRLEAISGEQMVLRTQYAGRWLLKTKGALAARITLDQTAARTTSHAEQLSNDPVGFELEDGWQQTRAHEVLLLLAITTARCDMNAVRGRPPGLPPPPAN